MRELRLNVSFLERLVIYPKCTFSNRVTDSITISSNCAVWRRFLERDVSIHVLSMYSIFDLRYADDATTASNSAEALQRNFDDFHKAYTRVWLRKLASPRPKYSHSQPLMCMIEINIPWSRSALQQSRKPSLPLSRLHQLRQWIWDLVPMPVLVLPAQSSVAFETEYF